jgi:hypothetical protein
MGLTPKYYQLSLILACLLLPAIAMAVSYEICYDFGCRHQAEIVLSDEEWSSIEALLKADKAADERQQLKLAVARMEYLTGLYSPTHRDVGMNLPVIADGTKSDLFPGQLDCIDESINTTRYLKLFEQAGLLRFHRVEKRAYRRSFFDQHWAAQLQDLATKRRYVIDSWFDDNGELPVLVSSERWLDLSR